MSSPGSRAPWWEKYHRPILLIFGLAGIADQALLQNFDRPYLLAVFGGMVGLPFILQADRLITRDQPPEPPPEPSAPEQRPPLRRPRKKP